MVCWGGCSGQKGLQTSSLNLKDLEDDKPFFENSPEIEWSQAESESLLRGARTDDSLT